MSSALRSFVVLGSLLGVTGALHAQVRVPPVVEVTRAVLDTLTLDVPLPSDSGQCDVFGLPRGQRSVSVYYPSKGNYSSTTIVTVDSAGGVVRYTDQRGISPLRVDPYATRAQVDSAIRVQQLARRRTFIMIDVASGRAYITNQGGGTPGTAVSAQLNDIADHERFGAPMVRAAAIVKRCGTTPATIRLTTSGTASHPYFEFQVEKKAQVAGGPPRYPPELRAAHVQGEVVVQFVVDENAMVVPGSFKVLRSSHALFSQAVAEAVSTMTFTAAEVGGKKVAQLVQMPFNFQLPPP